MTRGLVHTKFSSSLKK